MKREWILFLVCSVILIGGFYVVGQNMLKNRQQDHETRNKVSQETAKVVAVTDGDTITVELNGQEKKLRYVGMDTPETVDPHRPVGCFGHEASEANKKLVLGKTVYLEKDQSETDKFGRLLRYVYLPIENDQMLLVNDYLVREGFAIAKVYLPDNKLANRLADAQSEAELDNRGLWSHCKLGKVN